METNPAKQILVVAAHSDDEALGCGGAIAKHAEQSDRVSLICLTDGVGSRETASDRKVGSRRKALESAAKVLGIAEVHQLNFPDNAMDSVPLLEIVQAIESCMASRELPDRVYTHFAGDLNVDHRIAREAVLTCFRPQPQLQGKPSEILAFEVLSSTHWAGAMADRVFAPNYFVDISSTLEKKVEALQCYSEEMREWPHARSVESVCHLSKFRGASVGLESAEAFFIERMIES